jgi:hypothetical protein
MPQIGLFDNIWSSRIAPPKLMPMPPVRPPGQMLGMPSMPPAAVASMMPQQMLPPAAPQEAPVDVSPADVEKLKTLLAGQQRSAMLQNLGQGMVASKPQFGEPPPLPAPLQLPQQPIDLTMIQKLMAQRPMLGFGGRRA